jgi:xanthine dehydrogenase accessory factor
MWDKIILFYGAGEMASGVAVRLFRAGFRNLIMLEVEQPLAVRRAVSFCEAVYDGRATVEDLESELAPDVAAVPGILRSGRIPVLVDPEHHSHRPLGPEVVVDAVLAKVNLCTRPDDAPLVVGLGPGFTAGRDCRVVVETNRGHDLGRLIFSGEAEPNTGVPGDIAGRSRERVLRAPCAGVVAGALPIGTLVRTGDEVCRVAGKPVRATIDGMLRGMIREGLSVPAEIKIGDVDPRGAKARFDTISEKSRALGGAVLEAVCAHFSGSLPG